MMNDTSIISAAPIVLTDDDREKLITLGGLRWPEEKIAGFFGWTRDDLRACLSDPENEISRLLMRGELEAEFKIEARLMSDAQGGDLTAARQLREMIRDRDFKLSKTDLFGGSEDRELFNRIQKYISAGSPGNMSAREQLYIDGLQLIYSLEVKFGERKTVRLLTKEPYSLTFDKAKDLVCEAVELFNGGRRNSKESLRFHTAECYDTLYHAVLDSAKGPQDYAVAAGILDKKVKLLQLDGPEVDTPPPAQYNRIFRVLSLTPESLGLPAANRDELAAQIDALDVPDSERRRLKMEAGVIDTDIAKMIQNVAQEES
ncbi:MAG: hypothetical protein IJS66_00805 [Bacteroidales bacterium]|nr:hypothetical protein [Bacteroidales bacterium]